MKKHFLTFALFVSITASAQVTHVEPVGANYANKTVSFRVWWNAGSRNATHLSRVWVWVDYITVNSNNTTSGNSWTRATVGTISGGITSYDGSNRNGFCREGNASAAYSATLTVQLTNVPAKFNWCAYVSDFPPNMVMDEQTYYFKGTSPFILKEANGTAHEITQTSMPKANLTFVPVSITDKTECPGGLKEVIGTCAYTGADWYADPNHKCQQRATGAQNWEAWIKDTRDNDIYRIVLMPDDLWWTAEEMRYDASATNQSYKCKEGAQRMIYNYPVVACPNGWSLPSTNQYGNLKNYATLAELRDASNVGKWALGTDKFGFSVIASDNRNDGPDNTVPNSCFDEDRCASSWATSDEWRVHMECKGSYACEWCLAGQRWNQARCIR